MGTQLADCDLFTQDFDGDNGALGKNTGAELINLNV